MAYARYFFLTLYVVFSFYQIFMNNLIFIGMLSEDSAMNMNYLVILFMILLALFLPYFFIKKGLLPLKYFDYSKSKIDANTIEDAIIFSLVFFLICGTLMALLGNIWATNEGEIQPGSYYRKKLYEAFFPYFYLLNLYLVIFLARHGWLPKIKKIVNVY